MLFLQFLGGLVILVSFLLIIVFLVQEWFIFKPEKLPADFEFQYKNQQFEEYNFELEKDVNINGIHFKLPNPKGVVFYLKGNSRSIKGWGKYAVDFTRNNFDVLMVDYRGFGKSTGKRSEEAILSDLQALYDLLKQQVDEKYIILYGRSLGSGFATYLASFNSPRMLILDAPYYSLRHVIKKHLPLVPVQWVMRYSIKTHEWIENVKCPIHILHGTSDRLISFKNSINLCKSNLEMTRLYPIIEAGHNNMHTFKKYHEYLNEILNSKKKQEIDLSNSSITFKRKKKKN